jgi:hypothetical protein
MRKSREWGLYAHPSPPPGFVRDNRAMSLATGNPKGRPSQLKDPARSTILTAIRCGSTYCGAAEAASICYSTFRG